MHQTDDFSPIPGRPETLSPGVRRILCDNPSAFTYRGTNTYLVGRGKGIAVIDPGPMDVAHQDAILAALAPGEEITHIFVTHAHADHSPLARLLSKVTGAPVLAFGDVTAGQSEVMRDLAAQGGLGGGEGADPDFRPGQILADGDVVTGDGWRMQAIWTPGHLCNHLSFDHHLYYVVPRLLCPPVAEDEQVTFVVADSDCRTEAVPALFAKGDLGADHAVSR